MPLLRDLRRHCPLGALSPWQLVTQDNYHTSSPSLLSWHLSSTALLALAKEGAEPQLWLGVGQAGVDVEGGV